jgi:hypothetical protein
MSGNTKMFDQSELELLVELAANVHDMDTTELESFAYELQYLGLHNEVRMELSQ